MSQFKFALNETVSITASAEKGSVIGRAEYSTNENQYQLRYASADGSATESWWAESALEAA